MTSYQKTIIIVLIVFIEVFLYLWRQDVKYKRCLEMLRLGAGEIEQYKMGNCPVILRKNISQ